MSSLMLWPGQMAAQLLFSDGFEGLSCPASPCGGIIDNTPACLPAWHNSHGTPHIRPDAGGSNHALCMTYNAGANGEGAFRTLPGGQQFLPCEVYSISFRIETVGMPNPGNASYQIALTNGLQAMPVLPDPPACSGTIPQPAAMQVIFSQPASDFPAGSGWHYFTCQFVPSENFAQLWVSATATGLPGNVVNFFCIDDISVARIGPVGQPTSVATITPSPVCPGTIFELKYRICQPLLTSSYMAQANLPAGFSAVPGFPNPVTVGITSAGYLCYLNGGGCTEAVFRFMADPGLAPGLHTIPLQITPSGLCLAGWTDDVQVEIAACPPPELDCECPDPQKPRIELYSSHGAAGVPLSHLLIQQRLPPVSISGHCLVVKGQLRIDQGYRFEGCDIQMEPGAEIAVAPSTELEIEATALSGCTEMWRGIRAESRAALRIAGSSSLRDAQYGVHAAPGFGGIPTSLKLTGSRFEDNFVGLIALGGGAMDVYLEGNTFSNPSGTLLPPFSGQSSTAEGLPAQNQKPLAGIVLRNTVFTESTGNAFDGLVTGISSQHASLSSRRDTFAGLHDDDGFYPGWDAPGIAVDLRASGAHDALVAEGKFSRCRQGIRSSGVALVAQDNAISEVEAGIGAAMSTAGAIEIKGNDIEDAAWGIFAAHAHPDGALAIVSNKVRLSETAGAVGIWALFTKAPAKMLFNQVTVPKMGSGIAAHNLSGATLFLNTVELQDQQAAQYGIGASLLKESLLESNTVLGSGTGGSGNIALYIASSSGNAYCCNTLDNTRIGAQFTGDCLATDNFRGTAFSRHSESLWLPNSNAILGSQAHTQNCWAADAGPAVYGVPFTFAENYPFIVDPGQAACYMPPSHSPPGWFEDQSSETHSDVCNESPCMITYFAPDSDDAKRVAAGDTAVSPAVMWELQRYLYGRLQGESVADSALLQFLAESGAGSIGAFHALEAGIAALLAAEGAAGQEMEGRFAAAEAKRDSLAAIRAALSAAAPSEAAVLEQQRAALLGGLAELSAGNAALLESLQAGRQAGAALLYAQNEAIHAAQPYEANEKAVNGVYLSWLGSGAAALPSTDIALLEAIAAQCPFTGGNAVYRARAFLAAAAHRLAGYDDQSACAPPQMLAQPGGHRADAAPGTRALRLFPNPARDQVHLRWQGAAEQPGQAIAYDAYGRQVRSIAIMPGSAEAVIDVGSLPDGLYIIRIRLDGEDTARRIIVKH